MNKTRQIEEVLRRADVEGYIEFGAPSDEYESEAHVLSDVLGELNNDQMTVSHIETVVSALWRESFHLSQQDLELRQENLNRLAHDLVGIYLKK